MKLLAGVVVISALCRPAIADERTRTLTFEDRVRAQEAIERVYYKHQLGATKPFDAAIPRAVLEGKVRRYLEQTVALQSRWKTEVTDDALERELARMTAGTRMPDRLTELYAALGNDPFLIKECLARATLVDRLTRNFSGSEPADGFEAWRKTSGRSLIDKPVPAVASERAMSLVPHAAPAAPAAGACTLDSWDNRSLDDGPEALRAAVSIWTGSEMIAWSSESPGAGWRYDPAIDHWRPMSIAGVPSPRFGASVVWTGTAMVVWGGRVGEPPYPATDTGARYDPITDTWTPTSTAGAPSARSEHSAVWTGSRMVVWGGADDTQLLGSGGLYDPAADTWTPTASAGAPSARTQHAAVWTGNEMVVFGGYAGPQSSNDRTGARYDPVANTWTPTSIAGAPVTLQPAAFWTGNTMIVWDGFSGGRYDPVSNGWSTISTTNAPSPRRYSAAVWTGSRLVVWGGRDVNSGEDINTGARYDPVADQWTPTSAAGAAGAREGHTAVWTGQRMIVWGGSVFTSATGFSNVLTTGGRYDPATDTWTPTATGVAGAPSPRSGHTAVWTGNQILIWGGDDKEPAGISPLGNGGRYDPATDSWTTMSTANAPSPRRDHTAVWTGSAMIVWGGGYYVPGVGVFVVFDTGGRYDPLTDSWSPTSTLGAPVARDSHTAVWTGSKMVVWGGVADAGNGNRVWLATGGRYDPATNSWAPTATTGAPSPRPDHSAVWTGSEMLIWGGGYLGSEGSTGGRYNPATDTWAATSLTGAPAARSEHVALWTGSRMLIWGGAAEPPPFDGGSYDPATNSWQAMTRIGQPAALVRGSAVWTGSEMVVWGGLSGEPSESGGRYDPATNTWRGTTTVGAASARYDHTAIFTGSRMVVWGGARSTVKLATGGTYILDGAPTDECDGDGFTIAEGDCDDYDPSVHPGAAETCNGADDDCNGTIDDGGSALCDDGNPCMSDTCEPQGGCVHTPEPEFTSCDDDNACSGYNDYCDGFGFCEYDPLQCNDFYDCSLDTCDRIWGCQYEYVTSPAEISGLFVEGDKATFDWTYSYIATAYDVIRGRIDALPVGPGAGDETCFPGVTGTSFVDASLPGPGSGYWYLVRGKNTCAVPGSLGAQSDGTPRETTSCP